MPRPIILDVDTGTDDAIAIMMAALSPDIELVACTTVWGNLPVANTTDNASLHLSVRELLEQLGPVLPDGSDMIPDRRSTGGRSAHSRTMPGLSSTAFFQRSLRPLLWTRRCEI